MLNSDSTQLHDRSQKNSLSIPSYAATTRLSVFIMLVLGLMVHFFYREPQQIDQAKTTHIETRRNKAVTPKPTYFLSDLNTKWITFTDYSFSLEYPSNWSSPITHQLSTRREIIFNNILIIDIGVFYDQVKEREVTFRESIESYSSTLKTQPQDYLLGNVKGKKFVFTDYQGITKVFIVTAKSESSTEMFKISYDQPHEAKTTQVIDQVLSTIEIRRYF